MAFGAIQVQHKNEDVELVKFAYNGNVGTQQTDAEKKKHNREVNICVNFRVFVFSVICGERIVSLFAIKNRNESRAPFENAIDRIDGQFRLVNSSQ